MTDDSIVSHPSLPDYRLRLKEPSLCDPSVQQYSGYLDVTDGKHTFFWYSQYIRSCFSPPNHPMQGSLNPAPPHLTILWSCGSLVDQAAAHLWGFSLSSGPALSPRTAMAPFAIHTVGIHARISCSLINPLVWATATLLMDPLSPPHPARLKMSTRSSSCSWRAFHSTRTCRCMLRGRVMQEGTSPILQRRSTRGTRRF